MLTMLSMFRTMIADFVPTTFMHDMFTLHNDLFVFLKWSLTEITLFTNDNISDTHTATDILNNIFFLKYVIANNRNQELEDKIDKQKS